MNPRLLILPLSLACLLLSPPTPGAEERPLWELGAGAGTLTIPDYRGSDERHTYFFPIPYFVYRGKILQVDRDKIRGLLFKTERVELDFSLNGSFPVDSGDNKARRGMPDLEPTLELGPRVNVLLNQGERTKLTLQMPLRKVIAVDRDFDKLSDAGWIFNPILNLDIKNSVGPGWNLGLSGGPIWGDGRHHQYFYGVKQAFATADRAAYDAPGGYSGAQVTVALSKRFPNTWFGAFVRVNDLHGAAFEESPLMKQKTSIMAGLGFSWIFAQSSTRVMADE